MSCVDTLGVWLGSRGSGVVCHVEERLMTRYGWGRCVEVVGGEVEEVAWMHELFW